MQHNMAKRMTSTVYRGMRPKQGRRKRIYLDPPYGNGLLVASLVVSTASSQFGLARAPTVGEDVGDADADTPDLTKLRTRQIS